VTFNNVRKNKRKKKRKVDEEEEEAEAETKSMEMGRLKSVTNNVQIAIESETDRQTDR
jgi:hypothetical protein